MPGSIVAEGTAAASPKPEGDGSGRRSPRRCSRRPPSSGGSRAARAQPEVAACRSSPAGPIRPRPTRAPTRRPSRIPTAGRSARGPGRDRREAQGRARRSASERPLPERQTSVARDASADRDRRHLRQHAGQRARATLRRGPGGGSASRPAATDPRTLARTASAGSAVARIASVHSSRMRSPASAASGANSSSGPVSWRMIRTPGASSEPESGTPGSPSTLRSLAGTGRRLDQAAVRRDRPGSNGVRAAAGREPPRAAAERPPTGGPPLAPARAARA